MSVGFTSNTAKQLFTLRASRRGRFACGGNAATRPEGRVGMELELELESELELEWSWNWGLGSRLEA